jgi:flagellar hook-length control protein FliK
VQKAEVAVVPAASEAVQPGKPGTQTAGEISVESSGAAAVKEAQAEKAVKPVEKPASTQETGMPSVEVSRGFVQAPEIQAKQGPSQAALAQQVTAGMELMMRQGRSSMHIQLSPQDMGGINIHLVSNSAGVTVTVTADQAGTGHMLQNQADQLRQALNDAGVHVANLNVGQQQLSGQFNQDRETFAQAQSNRFRVPREAAAEETKPILGVYQAGGGSVDYRV